MEKDNLDSKTTKTSLDAEFREAVKGTKPLLSSNRVNLSAQRNKPKPFRKEKDSEQLNRIDYLSDGWEEKLIDFEETIKFCHTSISSRYFREIKLGKIPIEDHLDLHGLTIEQARKEVEDFLFFCSQHHVRYVRIIHGKGYRKNQDYPILKNKVNSWLKQHPQILAFHSALAKDGGTGAVYVLLKQQTEELLD